VRTGLAEADIDFGVFGLGKKADANVTPKRRTHFSEISENGKTDAIPEVPEGGESDGEEDEEERQSRPVIKLRPSRHRPLSRSRSRRDLSRSDDRRPASPDITDKESIANVRFSAHIVTKTDLSSLMPFALITPEPKRRRARATSVNSSAVNSPLSPTQQQLSASEDGHGTNTTESISEATSPSTQGPQRNFTFLHGPPEPLRNVFTRRFRWGTIDVLNPDHCDFAALRTVVLSTHLKVRILLLLFGVLSLFTYSA